MATERPRYTVSVDQELFEQIEEFRFKNRYPTRSAATVVLIQKGLEQLLLEEKNKESGVGIPDKEQ